MVLTDLSRRSASPRITLQSEKSAGLATIPFTINAVAPPYTHLEPVPDLAQCAEERLRPGMIWIIKATTATCTTDELAAWIPRLRVAYPAVPVALWLDDISAPASIKMAIAAGNLRVRALLTPGNPMGDELRRQMTTPHDLATDLIEWLQLHALPLPSQVISLIHTLVGAAYDEISLGAFLGQKNLSERTVRSWFTACGLPGPGSWFTLARLLPAVLDIQREPRVSLLTIALESGYSDHSTLSHQTTRLLGIRPGMIRGTIGWEWLMMRFLGGRVGARAVADGL